MKNGKSSPLAVLALLLLALFLLPRLGRILGIFAVIVAVAAALGIAALIFFIIRAIVRSASKKDGEETAQKPNPVNTRTEGEMQRARREAQAAQQAEAARAEAEAKRAAEAKAAEEAKYPPEVRAVVEEGRRAHRELDHLYAVIPDLSVKKKIQELMDVSDKIIADAVEDPSDVPQIKKFLDYYLPTTIKLLNAYDRMGAQGIEGGNIARSMQSINEMLDTAIDAYKHLLDSLFANQALDIETDIEVMNTLLKREGFNSASGGMMQGGTQ